MAVIAVHTNHISEIGISYIWSTDTSERITLVLFRTRRRDECARLKESARRRVRKSRQKEAAGAADAGLMQIEWGEGGCRSSLEWSRRVEKEGGHCAKDESMTEVDLGRDRKKMSGWKGETLRRDALKM